MLSSWSKYLVRNLKRTTKTSRFVSEMSFNTKILTIKTESIKFHCDDGLPTIDDVETKDNLLIAAETLRNTNNVVGFPTETVYGLGGSATNDESVRSIYRAKNRPADNPLIVHIASIDQLKRKILPPGYEIPHIYAQLIEKFWPGPLTILLPVHEASPISTLVTAGQPTFAVRMPSHPVARSLIALSDTPLAAPSANASTRPSPTLATHVFHDLNGKIPYILDGGASQVGLESTVVDGLVDPPMLLRPGGISLEDIKLTGKPLWDTVLVAKKTAASTEAVRTPGMKYRHYSPTAKVALFVNCENGKTAINNYLADNNVAPLAKIAILRSINFLQAPEINPQITIQRDLGLKPSQVSHNLFKFLREVDELGVDLILVEGIEETYEGRAVMNRLSKAALHTIDGSHTT